MRRSKIPQTHGRAIPMQATPESGQSQRRRDLALIHKGKAALAWSDDDYRMHLQRLTGLRSAADLDAPARRKVLQHMETCGWRPSSTFKAFDQAAKIDWLWRKLHEAGATHDGSKAGLLDFVGRHTGLGVSDLKFLPVAQASSVIEALKAWLTRARKTTPSPPR